MSAEASDAGTGIETASQAQTDSSPAATNDQEAQATQLDSILPQGGEAAPDTLAGITPQTPEDAAPEAAETPLEIAVPEGIDRDEETISSFLGIAKEAGIKQEAAQKLFDLHVAQQQKNAAAAEKAFAEHRARVNSDWARQCRADGEFGGENYQASCNYVTAAIRRFIPDSREQAQFVDFYQKANLQNAPFMFRFLARVGRDTAEAGAAASDASSDKRDLTTADKLFPEFPSERT